MPTHGKPCASGTGQQEGWLSKLEGNVWHLAFSGVPDPLFPLAQERVAEIIPAGQLFILMPPKPFEDH